MNSSQLFLSFFFTIISFLPGHGEIFDVKSFDAVGDGVTDDTLAFSNAWQQSCQTQGATLLVPQDNTFMVSKITFDGECQGELVFQVDGTIVAPGGPDQWPSEANPKDPWILFESIHGMRLQGNGIIDGRGQKWWDLPCKPHRRSNETTQSVPCDSPLTLRFFKSSNITLHGLNIKNSPQFHVKFDECENIHIESPGDSLNTDGIHLGRTKDVQINNSVISNGDDCVSIRTYCYNVNINNLTCSLGHGISIGSLGEDHSHACVSNITITNSIINGVRIKTWQGGSFNITFNYIQIESVRFPIIIDQYYCSTEKCKNESSAVMIHDIYYENIKGTYENKNGESSPVNFACSDALSCKNLKLVDIELHPAPGEKNAYPFCWNAHGKALNFSLPIVNCLNENGFPLPIEHIC
ncbi:polygalacturonase At1g48100-like [Carica papaya]|uniref:polygalacturonase At1g48100-like n=1 Tax=Carica papaya TaxID=3649 RepID=UPI000B8CE3B1|nr:polygalacturonase At1g48100-like [Carica papaya]